MGTPHCYIIKGIQKLTIKKEIIMFLCRKISPITKIRAIYLPIKKDSPTIICLMDMNDKKFELNISSRLFLDVSPDARTALGTMAGSVLTHYFNQRAVDNG